MKKFFLSFVAISFLVMSCNKLDVPVESQYVPENFPQTAADYSAVIGPLYTQLSSKYSIEYMRMQELSSDEAIIPARDGNYDDGGQYRQHHHHTYTQDHSNVIDVWAWGFGGINSCNRIINIFNQSPLASDNPVKVSALAEVRALRALFYYFMMDIYGNVPIINSFPVLDLPTNKPRAEVFAFIEKELKDIIPALPVKTAANATLLYGKPTRAMAFALLAKIYINAEIYTGTPRYTETVTYCDSILTAGNYALDANWTSIFAPDNGPQIQETIFAIPYDALLIPGQQFTRHSILPYLGPKYGVPTNISISMSTTPEFHDRYNLPGDVRSTVFLVGKQFNFDGSPLYFPTTTRSLDQFYAGADKDTLWQMEIYKPLKMLPGKPFDLGNDLKGRFTGVRNVKYYPDKAITAATRMGGNDVPVFRLADIILMKAEAVLRGATPTAVKGELQTTDVLVNKIRKRVGAPLVTGIDLKGLLDERGREFFWELYRRNDLIRFGQFEVEYPIPGDVLTMNKDPRRRIFPIPSTELKLNPNLVQNPGY